ncbi:hypothetical protein LWI29_019359 [Acer saccharum]|uniref:Uncharacterized protein n=1 Tax=Acer saccharum TaxID=4024 RepID=A0AA39SUD1_ACESA|nr:hypothetical protein LWI29_019359 [Acer saccharum]
MFRLEVHATCQLNYPNEEAFYLCMIIPSEILVKTGNGLFPIRIEESSSSVSSEWLSKTLGLNPGARFKVEEEIATDEFPLASGEGEWRLVERCQCKSDRAVDRSKDQLCVRKKGEIRGIMGPNFRRPRKDLEDREARSDKATLPKEPFLNLCVEEKGKGKWIRKLKSKPPRFPACKGGIRIGVDRPSQKSSSSSAESSSSEDELAGRGFFQIWVGECSKGIGPSGPPVCGGLVDKAFKHKRNPTRIMQKADQMAQIVGSP